MKNTTRPAGLGVVAALVVVLPTVTAWWFSDELKMGPFRESLDKASNVCDRILRIEVYMSEFDDADRYFYERIQQNLVGQFSKAREIAASFQEPHKHRLAKVTLQRAVETAIESLNNQMHETAVWRLKWQHETECESTWAPSPNFPPMSPAEYKKCRRETDRLQKSTSKALAAETNNKRAVLYEVSPLDQSVRVLVAARPKGEDLLRGSTAATSWREYPST